ncbi:MAG: asnB [Mucilaginibacter sp.]|nr:asnB [Mucilaginibacter sp.]
MCGINGVIYKEPIQHIFSKINLMDDMIIHRGPDDEGTYTFENRIAMGMRRLSIIDLEHGKQPMYSDDKNLVVVFNGEIYNFLELKKDLEGAGVRFYTGSDTEVILRLYEIYGKKSFVMLNGMFAFSIHDKIKNEMIIVRDRFGEKPLYYTVDKDRFMYASELKSIVKIAPEVKVISEKSLFLYFTLTYIPAPYTVYTNVFKLKAGNYITINTQSLEVEEQTYWDINLQSDIKFEDYVSAKKQLRTLLFDSVEKRMIADVPIGVFLSGGVDSTIIAAIMSKVSGKKINTFSIGYENKRYDESKRARIVSDHINSLHHEYILDYNDILDKVDDIILNYDEPFADSSCLPTYYVSKQTANHVKVALTGDGGDEVFGGYNKYQIHSYGKTYESLVPEIIHKRVIKPFFNSAARAANSKSPFAKMKKMVNALGRDVVSNHLNIISLGFQKEQLLMLFNNKSTFEGMSLGDVFSFPSSTNSRLKLARYIDKDISLEGDMLVKVDRASMLCSLECRAPFLDHRLMEFTYQIPDEFLIKGSNKKRILKDTFDDLLPGGFFNSPKSGFEIPVGEWFRGKMKADLDKTLSAENMERHNLLNINYVRGLISEHVSLKADHSWQLWTLYCFQKWYNKNLIYAENTANS